MRANLAAFQEASEVPKSMSRRRRSPARSSTRSREGVRLADHDSIQISAVDVVDEWVRVANVSSRQQDLTGWSIADEGHANVCVPLLFLRKPHDAF